MTTNRIFTTSILILFCLAFFGPAARAQVCSPPLSGMVAWYRGEGNAFDSSGNGHHGDVSSAGIAAGHVGQAFNFTAQDQSVVIPNHPSMIPLTALTVEGWLNPLPYSGCVGGSYRTFHTVQFEPLRGYVPLILCGTGQLVGALFDSAGVVESVTSNATIPTDTFTHFAMTWDGSNLRIYLNGALDNSAPTTMAAIGTNTDPLRIGNAQALGFRGLIDEISLYNRALSGAEVAAIFNAGTAGKCLVPTAAEVSISGRILSNRGRGISGARITLTDLLKGTRRTATSNTFGYYKFEEVEAGVTYIMTAFLKRYEFNDSPRVIAVDDDLTDINFVASR